MTDGAENVPHKQETPRTDRRVASVRMSERQRRRRVAFGVISVLILILAAFLFIGYFLVFIKPSQELIVRVNEVEYTRGDMVKILRVRQRTLEQTGTAIDRTSDIFLALQTLVENEIIAQSAPSIGITVSKDEVDYAVETTIVKLLGSGARLTGSASQTRDFKERYKSFLNNLQISEDEHRQMVRRAILREKIRQFVGESVPTIAKQYHVYRLTVMAADELDILASKYNDMVRTSNDPAVYAAAFKAITREFSRAEPERLRLGGEIGWIPTGILEDFDDVITTLRPGKLSEPLMDFDSKNNEMFIFMVSETEELRQIDPGTNEVLKNNALQSWINEKRREHDVFSIFNSEIYSWILGELSVSTSITPTPRPEDPSLNPLGQRPGR